MTQAPAPWIVSKRQDRTVIRDADTNEVCEVFTDAQLIAAAPDLLAALQHALDRFESIPAHQDEAGIYRYAAAMARAAISKANGE